MKDLPNVLFVFSDQHRAQAMSCAGDCNISTPNLDRLAREGLTPLASAMPWRSTIPAPRPGRALFRFEELPVVETRPLSVYEEVCT